MRFRSAVPTLLSGWTMTARLPFADDVRDDDQTVVRAFNEYRVAMKLPALTGC
jgi:hypothetical protein